MIQKSDAYMFHITHSFPYCPRPPSLSTSYSFLFIFFLLAHCELFKLSSGPTSKEVVKVFLFKDLSFGCLKLPVFYKLAHNLRSKLAIESEG